MQKSSFSMIYPEIGKRIQIAPSKYGYASGYRKPKSIQKQAEILSKVFPLLSHQLLNVPIFEQKELGFTEGLFVIPHWLLIAQTYHDAVLTALERLREIRGGRVYQYSFGKMRSNYLSRGSSTERAFKIIGGERWWSRVVTIPAQFGIDYRGVSSQWAKRMFREREYGLGLFEVIIMLITHPERLDNNDDLWIECPGDSYAVIAEKDPINTPFVNIIDGEIGIGSVPSNEPGARYGSATWLLPDMYL